ncbi:hypothetical protein BWQ96_08846 [Gracilariopsis chorda]|uniref:Uncharacterized protein n=1 Tax=Gracilariopsis chorda TaxID=448386 RepID=A0A2V3IHA1_9FLOR|nr:hypothetical protein BWQ96_08846 [Gracilariopsis chorda]|eukprot:PXF41465.1 hypothetical protein BWQ96_08846 [Gracilariopsis chorda]
MVPGSQKFMPAFLLVACSGLSFFTIHAAGTQVEVSVDSGRTWIPYSEPVLEAPAFAHMRVSGGSPFIRVPSCALKGALFIQVWTDSPSANPIGMRWSSKFCNPSLSQDTDGIVVERIRAHARKPEWLSYTFEKKEHEEELKTEEKEEKSFWRRYGLYIMLFFVVALAQGIRQGLAEQRMEIEREELEKRQQRSSGSMRVVVPKRKATTVRKRALSTKTGSTPA